MSDSEVLENAVARREPLRVAPALGLPIAITDYRSATALLLDWAENRDRPRLVAAAATHLVTTARCDPEFDAAMRHFDVITPDGMPLVWYLNHFENAKLTDRVYGPTLTLHCLEAAQGPYRHLFIGGSDEMRGKLEREVKRRFPGLQIQEGYSPPFGPWTEEVDTMILEKIRRADAHFVWIGFGCPKQEFLLARLRDRLPPGVYGAVGAAFPLISGAVRQAPPRLQRLGLEWAFRLAMEPRRLWKRYLVYNSLFLWFTALEALRRVVNNRARPRTRPRPRA